MTDWFDRQRWEECVTLEHVVPFRVLDLDNGGKPVAVLSRHFTDKDGNPAGGVTCGRGFTISWQNGPLGRGDDRKEPNGAFVEEVIEAAIDRIRFYQSGKFNCEENAEALSHLELALAVLQQRTADREARGVEGTHEE